MKCEFESNGASGEGGDTKCVRSDILYKEVTGNGV